MHDTPRRTSAPGRAVIDADANDSDLAWLHRLAGRFVVFDGPDGSGKSTQFKRFLATCAAAGVRVCDVREPGGTAIGERIRDILLSRDAGPMSARCEMLLYMASRAQLVSERIAPAIARGELVLADRFVSSTLAYQGAGGGIPETDILAVARAACVGVEPDFVVIFDADEETASSRMGSRGGDGRDRVESRSEAYRRRVREGYLNQAERDPDRVAILDAAPAEDAVAAALLACLRRRFT